MMPDPLAALAGLTAAINIGINPELFDGGGFTLTWHGFFTAIGIALGVWLALRFVRRTSISEDDGLTIALVAVPAGIVGARLLWVFEHTDAIHDIGDVFAITDGGISVYGAIIGGVLGGFLYISIFRRGFPRWVALDVAAPGILLGQAVGRIGDTINGEHFAQASSLPWAFRYTNPATEGPWASFIDGEPTGPWVRGDTGNLLDGGPVAVHPVAGGYEPILDFLLLGVLLWMWWRGGALGLRQGWIFVTYVLGYAAIRGLLALLRTDEAEVFADVSVPQFLAILTAAAAGVMAWYLWRRPQPRVGSVAVARAEERAQHRDAARTRRGGRGGGGRGGGGRGGGMYGR